METSNSIIFPSYFRLVRCAAGAWYLSKISVFYNPGATPIEIENKEQQYGLTRKELAIELFRINAGKDGWYLANLRDRKYYYCGLEAESVKHKLRKLGIGQEDPIAD